ncbi:MAG TPA: carbon storage regulator [Pirellulales bacterium]|jgi:carbon storage regulator CsrA|nr:carbon storage regulator [Pirellulales bacterium]
MLVLSRKVGEKILIDDKVTVTVTRISGGRVSIGITAPSGVRIVRAELDPLPVEATLPRNRVSGKFPDEQPTKQAFAFAGQATCDE